jgi:amidophosphoribosyltransferase
LRPNREFIRGKRLVVVDDSIVRGTSTETMSEILFEAGATEVHYRISSAPLVNPCFSGVAISDAETLFARRHLDHEERVKKLGANSLGYLSVEGMARAMGRPIGSACMACMNGDYPFEVPDFAGGRITIPISVAR